MKALCNRYCQGHKHMIKMACLFLGMVLNKPVFRGTTITIPTTSGRKALPCYEESFLVAELCRTRGSFCPTPSWAAAMPYVPQWIRELRGDVKQGRDQMSSLQVAWIAHDPSTKGWILSSVLSAYLLHYPISISLPTTVSQILHEFFQQLSPLTYCGCIPM